MSLRTTGDWPSPPEAVLRAERLREVRNLPPPVQERMPLLIGGGERVTLKLVAHWADANNVGGSAERIAHKERSARRRGLSH